MTIPQQQLLERFDTLPDSLRTAIFDEPTTDFIWTTSENEHIPEEKIYAISKLAGYVFMGFLHPEDLAKEIQNETNVDMRTATIIQDNLNKRIFTPLRPDIDKAYQPISKTTSITPMTASSGPVILNDINLTSSSSAPTVRIQPQPKPISIATATATSRTVSAAPSISGAAIPNANIPPAAAKTNRLSDVGWSRSGSSDPVIKLDISPASRAVATPTAPAPKQQSPAPASQQTGAPVNHSLGEFERLNAMKKAPSSAVPPTPTMPMPSVPSPAAAPRPAAPSGEPAPFILHQDSSFKSQEKNSTFTLPKPEADAHIQMNAVRPPAPARPAVLEFGQASGQTLQKPPAPAPTSSNVVHYTQFGGPLSSMPTANTGPRMVSEIAPAPAPAPVARAPIAPQPITTAAVPVPVPPRPPMPPTPPRAPAQPIQPAQQQQSSQTQPEKVIVKDFL